MAISHRFPTFPHENKINSEQYMISMVCYVLNLSIVQLFIVHMIELSVYSCYIQQVIYIRLSTSTSDYPTNCLVMLFPINTMYSGSHFYIYLFCILRP